MYILINDYLNWINQFEIKHKIWCKFSSIMNIIESTVSKKNMHTPFLQTSKIKKKKFWKRKRMNINKYKYKYIQKKTHTKLENIIYEIYK